MANARYFFLPFLRRGLGNAIGLVRTAPGASTHPAISVTLGVGPDGGAPSSAFAAAVARLRLVGPGEVTGIDTSLVSRVEPASLSRNLSPNYFAHVEFAQPDLPWMFSPYAPDLVGNASRLTPWMVLLAVPKDPVNGGIVERVPGVKLPLLRFAGDPADHLPELKQAWAWAHVQVAIDGEIAAPAERKAQIKAILENQPDRIVSRLICPRQLQPSTTYTACVVPTFKAGVLSALGRPLVDPPDPGVEPDLAFAWENGALAVPDGLPVYYSWEFTTAEAGDFEALVRRLVPRKVPKDTGLRDLEIGRPGFGMPIWEGERIIRLEGALWAPDAERSPWPGETQVERDAFQQEFQQELQERLDAPANLQPTSVTSVNPIVAPPLYGRWYAARDRVPDPVVGQPNLDAERPVWFRELNLDPRERTVAGFGTRVIQREQEQLMHMAWQQIGDIKEANRLLIRTQFAREVNNSLYRRHFMHMPLDWLLAMTYRLHWRIFIGGESIADLLSRCSNWGGRGALVSPWAIRFYRPGGPIGGPWGGPTGPGTEENPPRRLPTPAEDGGGDPEDSIETVLEPDMPEVTNGCVCDFVYGGTTTLGSPPNCPPDPGSGSGDSLFGGLPIGDLTEGGDASASHFDWPLEGSDKAFDNDPNTRWRAPFTQSPWLKYELAGGQHRVVTSYSLTSASDHPGRDPRSWTFEGSHTGITWTVLDTQTNFTFATRLEEKTFTFSNAIAYSRYRLNISANHGDLHTQLAELQMFEDPAVYDDLSEGGTAAASDSLLGFGVEKLFDNNAGTKWIADATTAWARYSFALGREHIVTSYALTSADDDPPRDPKSWTFEGSHDGVAWTVLDTQSGITFAQRYQKKAFPIANKSGYAHYRLNISQNNGGSKIQLAELYLLGVECEEWPLCDNPAQGTGCTTPTREDIDAIPPKDDYVFPTFPGASGTPGADSPDAEAARNAAKQDADYVAHIAFIRARQAARTSCTLIGADIRNAILRFLDPEVTSLKRVRARLDYDQTAWDPVDPLHSIMAHPKIDKPMYQSLPDHDLLPGLEKVPPDSITLLRTNPRFIEAFMVGANHEFARELLWREYPTDQRGTVFRQFWDVAGRFPTPARPEDGYDIPEVVGWNPTFHLGETIELYGENSIELSPEDEGQVVLLIRGELLKRYPTADIYAVKGEWFDDNGEPRRRPIRGNDPEMMKQPLFRGTLDPDVTFFGFELTVSEAKGGDSPAESAGWYFAIQQQPFDPRFGLDVAQFDPRPPLEEQEDPDTEMPFADGSQWNALNWSHLATDAEALRDVHYIDLDEPLIVPNPAPLDEWGRNSSNMAEITWQLPVRILIHAENMLSQSGEG